MILWKLITKIYGQDQSKTKLEAISFCSKLILNKRVVQSSLVCANRIGHWFTLSSDHRWHWPPLFSELDKFRSTLFQIDFLKHVNYSWLLFNAFGMQTLSNGNLSIAKFKKPKNQTIWIGHSSETSAINCLLYRESYLLRRMQVSSYP